MADDDQDASRCGYPTKNGEPCRNKVERPGRPCKVHMKVALLDRILKARATTPDAGSAGDASSVDDANPAGEGTSTGNASEALS